MDESLEDLARRAARKARARLVTEGTPASPQVQPASASSGPVPVPRGPVLIDAEALARVPDGARFDVAEDALITPLALEEAERRGIRVWRSGAPAASGLCVAVGCDHAGLVLKADVLASLRELGARAIDFGTRDASPADYPDYAEAVGQAVAAGQCQLGVLIDAAGSGSAIAANKVPGVRAAACTDERMAESARAHNHANVLVLAAGWVPPLRVHAILRAFLAAAPGGERHARRIAKIAAIERRYSRARAP
jgi:ribose 5-phosphate isomerase B